jgi:hypothetical protein
MLAPPPKARKVEKLEERKLEAFVRFDWFKKLDNPKDVGRERP